NPPRRGSFGVDRVPYRRRKPRSGASATRNQGVRIMRFASTRMALTGIALGAAGALCALPLGHQAAAQGSANVAAAAHAAAGAAAKLGGISAGLGAASNTAAAAGISHSTSADTSGGDTSGTAVDHTTAAAADVSNGNDVDLALSG